MPGFGLGRGAGAGPSPYGPALPSMRFGLPRGPEHECGSGSSLPQFRPRARAGRSRRCISVTVRLSDPLRGSFGPSGLAARLLPGVRRRHVRVGGAVRLSDPCRRLFGMATGIAWTLWENTSPKLARAVRARSQKDGFCGALGLAAGPVLGGVLLAETVDAPSPRE
jgi:hypothetical protein